MKTTTNDKARALILLLSFLLVAPISLSAEDSEFTIVYSSREADGREIFLSDEAGQSRLRVTSFTGSDGYPAVSPDGKRLVFYGKYDDNQTWSIHTVNIDGSDMQRLTHTKAVWDSAPSWSPDGSTIVFAREYEDSEEVWQEEIWLMDADGSNLRQIESLEGRAPSFLEDGRILFHSKNGPSQISIANIDGSDVIRLTDNDANDWSPKVSPDGTQIVFISNRDGNQEIYTMNLDGSDPVRITFNEVDDWDPAWSVDGSKLFFATANESNSLDIYRANKDGSEMVKVFDNGLQIARVPYLDPESLERLKATNSQP